MTAPISNDPQIQSTFRPMQQVAQRIIEREREHAWNAVAHKRKLTLRERWRRMRGKDAPSK